MTAREDDMRTRLGYWRTTAVEWERLIAEKTERGMKCDVEEKLLAVAQRYVIMYVERIMQTGEPQ